MDAPMPNMPDKPKPTMYMDHSQVPAAADMMPGDDVHLHVHGKVISHRKDDKGGETQIEIHKVDPQDGPKKKKQNAANMPMDKLKDVIKSAQPKDNSNGHDA